VDKSRPPVYCVLVKRKKTPSPRKLKGPLHARITELRLELGLNQTELARALNVDKTAVWHWENGARPGLASAMALAKMFNVTLDELLNDEKAA